jgi:sec-independent protein translocase protein TatC
MNSLFGHFSAHFAELRRRIFIAFLSILTAALVAYAFSEQIVRFLILPLRTGEHALTGLVYTHLTEAFVSYLKVSLLIGLMAALPVCCYQVWMFVAPGLHRHEKRLARWVLFWGSLLFAAGVLFAWLVVLPGLLSFLLGFAGERLIPLPRMDAYLTFVVRAALTFGLAFEIPFLMVMAMRTGLVARDFFRRRRLYFAIAMAVLAFFITLGDPVATILLSVPLLLLYEAGILLGRLFAGKGAAEAQG